MSIKCSGKYFCIPAVSLFIDVLQLFSLIYEAKLAYSFFSSFTTAAWKMAKPFGLENGVFKGFWGCYCRKPFGICITLALHFYWAVDVYGRKKRWNLPSHSFSSNEDSCRFSFLFTFLNYPFPTQMRIRNNLIKFNLPFLSRIGWKFTLNSP